MNVRRSFGGSLLVVASLLAFGCREEQPTEAGDDAQLKSMRAEIEALVGTPSCDDSSGCATLAFGAKPCGGPWRYLVYSRSRADLATLTRKVDEYNRFEAEVNQRYGRVSDCMAVLPPRVGCVGGACVDLDRQ
jgi:hypothetical protein